MIRKAKKNDVRSILALLSELKNGEASFFDEEILSDERVYCAVYENEGEAVAFGSVVFYRTPAKGLVSRLEDIIVSESERGKGRGKSLVEHLVLEAKNRGASVCDLTSNPSRVAARALYESLGWKLRDTGEFRLKF